MNRYADYTHARLHLALANRDQTIKELRSASSYKTYMSLIRELDEQKRLVEHYKGICEQYQQWFTSHEYINKK